MTQTDADDIIEAGSVSQSPSDTNFELFYREHHVRLERALTLTLGSVEVGQDATAEAFARALQRWDRVSGFDNPAGWIFRVGVNWARTRRWRTRREVNPEEFSRIMMDDTGVGPLVDEHMVVTEALAQLRLEHRVVVVARFYLDWSEAELAAALDVPAGTVKSRTSRALKHLAQILEDER